MDARTFIEGQNINELEHIESQIALTERLLTYTQLDSKDRSELEENLSKLRSKRLQLREDVQDKIVECVR